MIKALLTLCVFLISMAAVSQPAKDSLLALNHQQVNDTLRVAQYLDETTSIYYRMGKEEVKVNNRTFSRYYNEIIMAHNPVTTIDISKYLGYAEGNEPKSWNEFLTTVYNKNIEHVISMTNVYGYPAHKRMRINGNTTAAFVDIIFITRSHAYDKQLKQMFKEEYAVGNISEKEYNYTTYILKRKKVMTDKDKEWLEKNAGIRIYTGS